MWTRIGLTLIVLAGTWTFYSPPVHAGCVVEGSVTYPEGTNIRDDKCDTSGAKKVTTGGASGATGGTANVNPPTLTEGNTYGFSLDLSGNMRTTLGTLLSGEDQANDLIQISGGMARQTTLASGVTTNTTSAAIIVPTGPKTFYGQVVCTSGACVQTQDIYGDIDNDAANGILLCTITLNATTRDQDTCPISNAAWSFYYVITTATSGTAATGSVYAMY